MDECFKNKICNCDANVIIPSSSTTTTTTTTITLSLPIQTVSINNYENTEEKTRKFLEYYSIKKSDCYSNEYKNFENYLKPNMNSQVLSSTPNKDHRDDLQLDEEVKKVSKLNVSENDCNSDEFDKIKHKDPIAHRMIEKKRRDRFNTQLEKLKLLLPSNMNRKGKMRIEKVEVIEMAIEYINTLHEELNYKQSRDSNVTFNLNSSSRNSTDSEAAANNNNHNNIPNNNNNNNNNYSSSTSSSSKSSSSSSPSYKRGLNDGMNYILEFLKSLNQIENKINEQAVSNAIKFRSQVIRMASDPNMRLKSVIDSCLRPKKQCLKNLSNSSSDFMSSIFNLKSTSSSLSTSSTDTSVENNNNNNNNNNNLNTSSIILPQLFKPIPLSTSNPIQIPIQQQQQQHQSSTAQLASSVVSSSSLLDSYDDNNNYINNNSIFQSNLLTLLQNQKNSNPQYSSTYISTDDQHYQSQQQVNDDVHLLDLDVNKNKSRYKKFKNDLITSHLKHNSMYSAFSDEN